MAKKKQPPADEFAPCRLVEHDDGTLSITFDEFEGAANVFEEHGYDAGGYAWHGVVDALVRARAPKIKKLVKYDPEGSMFAAYGKDRDALKQVAALIREALADHKLLAEFIAKAAPDLMD